MDGGLFPSAGAAELGVEVVPPPVVLAEVSMACTVLDKLAQQGAGELELFGLPLPLNSQAWVFSIFPSNKFKWYVEAVVGSHDQLIRSDCRS